MKISFVTLNFLKNDAIGNDIVNRVNILINKGHDVHVFVSDEFPLIRDDFEEITTLISFPELFFGNQFADYIRPFDKKYLQHFNQSQLLFFNYFGGSEIYNSITLRHGGIKIFDYHGVTPPELIEDGALKETYIRGARETALVRYTDYALVRSEHMRDELVETFGYPKDKIFIMPYAIDISSFKPSGKNRILSKKFNVNGHFVLIYVGRMAYNKQIDQLVTALGTVKKVIPKVKLLLVGNNEVAVHKKVMDKALGIADELDVRDSVIFTGELDHAELAKYYNLADIFITASLHEGFCIPVVEAMACGKPVIGTKTTALPGTIGNAGLLFDPNDTDQLARHIIRLLKDLKESRVDSLYGEMSRNAVERSKLFSFESYQNNFETFLNEVIDVSPQTRIKTLPNRSAIPSPLFELASIMKKVNNAFARYHMGTSRRFSGRIVRVSKRLINKILIACYYASLRRNQRRLDRSVTKCITEITKYICFLTERID